MMCFAISFMGGLLFVPLPTIYPLAYLGLATGHLGLRAVRSMGEEWRELLLYWMDKLRRRK
jgi:hypothetical protein